MFMNRVAVGSALVAAALAVSAVAVPPTMHHQGRLFDGSGVPLDSTETVTFAVFDSATGGSALWTENQNVTFDGGYFGDRQHRHRVGGVE